MDDNQRNERDVEEWVRDNRKQIIQVIRSSDDPFMRACAWALLDKHTSNIEIEDLHVELDEIAEQEEKR